MINALNEISMLSRMSVQDLKSLLGIARLVFLTNFIENTDEKGNSFIDIPTVGKIIVTEDYDFEFIPAIEFKKEIYNLKQNPNNFIKDELKKLFHIEGV